MVDPFAVVALSPRTFTVKERGDALANVKRINEFMDTAVMVAAWARFCNSHRPFMTAGSMSVGRMMISAPFIASPRTTSG